MTIHNTTAIDAFAGQLREKREIALQNIRAHLHAADDPRELALANYLDGTGDWHISDLLGDTDIAQLRMELASLQDIDAALVRVKNGRYGFCEQCGEAIPIGRLLAVPTARNCVACQATLEHVSGVVNANTL